MDNKKVEQVLKEIFDQYGTEIVQNRKKFLSAVYDLLSDEWKYKDERTVLKFAMESNAIPILLSSLPITSDSAQRAVEQMRKDTYMDSEAAKFVVQCVVAACGYNQDIVTENEKRRQAEEAERIRKEQEKSRQEEERKRREQEQRRQEEERKQREQEQRRQEEERKQREQRQQEKERKQREQEQKQQEDEKKQQAIDLQMNRETQEGNNCILEIECKCEAFSQLSAHLGKLYLYNDRLLFVQYSEKKKKQTEVFYRDIKKVMTFEQKVYNMLGGAFASSAAKTLRIFTLYALGANSYCTFVFNSESDKKQAAAVIEQGISRK